MARQTKEHKRMTAAVDAAFKANSQGHPVSVFDIGKVWQAGMAVALGGGTDRAIADAITAAFTLYSKAA